MGCGCSGGNNVNRLNNRNVRTVTRNVERNLPIATDEEKIESIRIQSPELFQKVIYHNGKDNTYAISYGRGLGKYGIRAYTSKKFSGDKELYILKTDLKATPKHKITLVEEAKEEVVEIVLPEIVNRSIVEEVVIEPIVEVVTETVEPVTVIPVVEEVAIEQVAEVVEKPKRQYKKKTKTTSE